MPSTSPSPEHHSPHVLDLSSKLESLEKVASGSVEAVRGTVGSVLQASDIALPERSAIVASRIQAAVAPKSAPAPEKAAPAPFQAYERTYCGITIPVRSASEERAVLRWERENERRFHAQPGALLRLYRGAPDAALTARRYAVEIEQRGTPPPPLRA